MKNTGIKTALNSLINRVEIEAKYCLEVETKKLKSDKLRRCGLFIHKYEAIRRKQAELEKQLERLSDELEKEGLTTRHCGLDDEFELTSEAKREVANKYAEIKKKLCTQRDNIIIRSPLSDEAERAFMVRYFYDEVATFFPSLKALVTKAITAKSK